MSSNGGNGSSSVANTFPPWIWAGRVLTTTYYHVRIMRRLPTTRRRLRATVWTIDWEMREVHAYVLHDMTVLLRLNVRYGARAWAVRDTSPQE
jgi:hypothetical protein